MSCGNRAPEPGPPVRAVSTKPGHTALARTPCVPYSTAADLVNEMTPAFDAL